MSLLLETPRKKSARRKYKRKPVQPKWSALETPLATLHPNQILTIFEWAQLNRISASTAHRILASGHGPTVTQMSPQRIGVTVGDNAAWQTTRKRPRAD